MKKPNVRDDFVMFISTSSTSQPKPSIVVQLSFAFSYRFIIVNKRFGILAFQRRACFLFDLGPSLIGLSRPIFYIVDLRTGEKG